MTHGGRQLGRIALTAVVLLVLLGGLSWALVDRSVAGRPSAAETASLRPADRGWVTVRDGTDPAPGPDTGGTVSAVITDVLEFFRTELPAGLRARITPPAGGAVAVDAAATALGPAGVPCVGKPIDIAGNAYFCPPADAIVYDSGGLVPVLLGHDGVAGLATSLAHEVGHLVQARIGPTAADRSAHPALYPDLLVEAQSDCYAGAFLAWLVAGRAPHLTIPPSGQLRGLAPLLDFRDATTGRPGDAGAHGLGVDRLRSALLGMAHGITACRALAVADLHPVLGTPGTVAGGSTRFGSAAAVLAAARPGIAALAARWPGGPAGPGSGLAPVTAADATADPGDLRTARPIGQFAVGAARALATGRALAGRTADASAAAACFTGIWTASVFGHAGPAALGGWTGDPDEALDLIRDRPGATVQDLVAFAGGFFGGPAQCGG